MSQTPITEPNKQIQTTKGAAAPLYSRRIPDLRKGERVLILQRQHPAVLLRKLLLPLLLLGLWLVSLPFIVPVIESFRPDPFAAFDGPPAWLPVALWVGWIALAVGITLWETYIVLDWSDDWVALSNRRIIIMNKSLFFRETRREAPLDQIQDVTVEYPEGMGVALDFGNVKIDTAGIGILEFDNLPRPKKMHEAIFKAQAALDAAPPSDDDRRRAAVLGMLQRSAPGNATSLLAPAVYQPSNIDLRPVTWRKHWIFLVRGLAAPTIIALVVVTVWIVSILSSDQGQYGSPPVILGWLAVVVTPICLLWGVWNWIDWRNDLYRLDAERVYLLETLPFGLREQLKETLITRVTDVTYVVPSPLAHLLNYGDVNIKTPGEATEFDFKGVPHPREVQQEVMHRVEAYRLEASVETDREIEAWLRAYHDVMGG